MRSLNILLLGAFLLLASCEHPPTTINDEPFVEGSIDTDFSVSIRDFEFDFFSRQFFYSVAVNNAPQAEVFSAQLLAGSSIEISVGPLNDEGLHGDILVNDGLMDGTWGLPDSLAMYMDSLWTLTVSSQSQLLLDLKDLTPQRPLPAEVNWVRHLDTLTLDPAGLVVDTLRVRVSHPRGLDEIRDVQMMSLKPNGELANNGQPIPLYDDGGSEVFFRFDDVDYTSGDSLAGDGIYSLLLVITPSNLSGTYYWTFYARTWEGIQSEIFSDSLIVLPSTGLARENSPQIRPRGVFQ